MRNINWRHFDFWLFGVVVILSIFGIVMIRSAIAGSESLADSVPRQIIFTCIGLVVIFIVTIVDYHFWASMTRPMYVVVILFLIVVFILGKTSFGSQRWIAAGLVNIQPSELAKIVIIIVLADFFARNQNRPHDLVWIGRSGLITGCVAIMVYLQPNLSTTIVILVIWMAMLWVSGLPPKYVLAFAVVVVVMAIAIFPLLQQYQQQRVFDFFIPQENARAGNTYNVDQALITIGSGGLFGMGYGHGTQVQLRFLKVRHTDFIFSAMAEEFGFIGTLIVVSMLIFVIIRCLRAARLANDMFGALIAYGFATLIFFQSAVNIGVNLQVIPVTGLTLPFISYGGSSILSLLLGIGLVESVILRHKPLEF